MRASELKAILREVRAEAAKRLGPEEVAVADALVALVERLSEISAREIVSRLSAIKAPRTAAKERLVNQVLVDAYVRRLHQLKRDHSASVALIDTIKTDRAVKKSEAIAIAKAQGVRTNSKTTKVQALQQVEGLSSARERDRQIADRIRKGA